MEIDRENFDDGYWVVRDQTHNDRYAITVRHHLLAVTVEGSGYVDWKDARSIARGLWEATDALAKKTGRK